MFSLKKTVFSLTILFISISFNANCQVTLYEENFDDINIDDYGYYGGAAMPGSSTSKWSIDQNAITWYPSGHFVVTNTRFESYKTGAVNTKRIIWKSSPIDISAYTATVSIVLGTAYKHSDSGIEAFYSTNNGSTWTSFGKILGNQSCPGGDYCVNPYSKSNITGTSLLIKVEHWGTNSTPIYYHDDVKVTGVINCSAPTSPATATGLTVSNATKNSLTVNWNSGNGTNVLVTAMADATVEVAPASSTVYAANTVFGDATKTTGTGNFVVYNGTNATSLTVTGLVESTTYKFYVYPYNISPGTCYLTTTPYTFKATTLDECNSPLAQASYINFPFKTKTDVTVNWTNGSGDRVLVVARKANVAISKPTFGTAYTANATFGSGQTTGIINTENFVVYDGTGTTVNVTGLTESTSYIFDVYTYYFADHCYKKSTTIDVNEKTVTTKSDYYNIKELNGTSITVCEGKVVDEGGIAGTYTSAGKQTLTISAESSTDGSCLNFTQWDLDNASEITFYDGATKIYTADAYWKQFNTTYTDDPKIINIPTFKGPGLVCSSPGNPLKIEFNAQGSANGFTAEITCYSPPKPCNIEVSSIRTGICKGESVELTASGFVGAGLLNNDFSSKTIGPDWSTVINALFDNKCENPSNPKSKGLDGTYFWVKTDPSPRDLTSKALNVSQGGSVAFDFRMGIQNDGTGKEIDYDVCEGPDLPEEGIFLEYSTDGSTWKQMHYFFPPAATSPLTNYQTGPYGKVEAECTAWKRYYFEIPKAAQTAATRFRWNQYASSPGNYKFDVWGLDRIVITAISPFKIIWKDITANQIVGTSNLNESPYKLSVSPTVTTTYEAQLIDATTGKTLCTKQLPISVSDFTVNPTPETVCGASNGAITFTTTGTNINYSINNGITYSTNPTFTGLQGGTYDVVFQSPTCTSTKKVTITSASGGPTVDAVTPISQCVGTATPIITLKTSPADPLITYNWSNDNTSIGLAISGSATIPAIASLVNTGTTPAIANIEVVPIKNGCTGTPQKFTITVKPKDDANFIATDYCEGSSGTVTISGLTGGTFTSNPTGLSVTNSNTVVSGGSGGTSFTNYELTYTTPNCSNTSKQTIKVNAKQPATFEFKDFCETDLNSPGGSATNILVTGGTFTLNTAITNGETIDAATGTLTNGKGGVNYSITYTPPVNSCYSSTTNNFKVNALDQISYTIDNICSGSVGTAAKNITPTGGTFKFETLPSSVSTTINGTDGIITNGVANETYNVMYYTNGTPGTTCSNSKSVKVKVIQTPAITIHPANTTDCKGKKVKFVVTATNALSYTWQEKKASDPGFTDVGYSGVYKAGVTPDTLHITDNTGLENSEYRVIVGEAASNSVCPVTSTSGKIIFKLKTAAPTINCDNINITTAKVAAEWNAYSSTATSFDVKYEYTDPNTSNPVTLTTNQLVGVKDFTLGSLAKNVDVKITVTPLGPDCYEIGTKTCKTLNCQQPTINTFTGIVSICENATNTTFAVTATPNTPLNTLTYAWKSKPSGGNYAAILNGGVYDLSDPTKLIITPDATTTFKSLKDVTFKVSITENGCVKDTVVQFKVDTLNIGGTLGNDSIICKGNNVLLTLKNNAGDVIKWQSSISPYTLYKDTLPPNIGKTYTTSSISAPTKFRAVVKSGLCPEAISSVKLIDTISSIGGTIVNDTAICYNQPAGPLKLKNYVGNILKWQDSTVSNPIWTDITNNSNVLTSGKLKETTYFRAEVQKNSCAVSYSSIVTATVNPLPIVNPKYTAPCEGKDLKLEGNLISSTTTYTWKGPGFLIPNINQNPIIANASKTAHDGTYTLIIKDGNNCIDSLNLVVAINPTPTILNTPLVVCEKSTLKLASNHSSATTNAWSIDNTNSTLDLIKNEISGVKKGTSKVTFTDDKECKTTELLTIESLPIVNFSSDVSICIIDSLHTVDKTIPNNCSLFWDFGDGTISAYPGHKYSQGGIYSIGLTAKTLAGCVDSIRKIDYLEVIGLPNMNFTFQPDSIDIFEPTIEFTNNSDAKHYKWVFGDGKPISLEKNPMHIYPDKADEHYDITLTGYNTAKGCQASVTKTIIAKEPIIYYIPNTFTPNSDEVNNTFKPIFFSGLDIFNYNLTVFNRWGEIVFISKNVEYGWDGTYGDKMVESGTYIWRLEFKEKNKYKKQNRTGHVNVLR